MKEEWFDSSKDTFPRRFVSIFEKTANQEQRTIIHIDGQQAALVSIEDLKDLEAQDLADIQAAEQVDRTDLLDWDEVKKSLE